VASFTHAHNEISVNVVYLSAIIDGFVLKKTVCLMMWVKLTNAPHLNFLGKILIKYSKDTQQLLEHWITNTGFTFIILYIILNFY
jgi:hypothetical protein